MKRKLALMLSIMLILFTGFSPADKIEDLKPSAGDLQEKNAIELAKDILIANYEDIGPRLSASAIDARFGYLMDEYDDPVWFVTFSNPDEFSGIYNVAISRTGEILLHQAPNSDSYGINGDEMTNVRIVEPGINDISEENALEIAKSCLYELSDYENRMDKLTTKACFLYGDRYNYGWEPVWLIYFYQDDVLQQKMLLGYDGSYISTASGDKKLEQTTRKDDGFARQFIELNFHMMDVEQKAAFSKEWIPKVEEYIQTHPYYANRNDLLYQATRHVYGIPGSDDMSQEDAKALAEQEIIMLGANPDTIATRLYTYAFDVTDTSVPFWRIFVHSADLDDSNEWRKEGNYNTYRVTIDSNARTVIEASEYDGYPYNF